MGLQDFHSKVDMVEITLGNERTSLLNNPRKSCCGNLRQIWPLLCIVLTVLLERTAYYGILSNLVLFLYSELKVPNDLTIVSLFMFTGMAWMISTIGGLIGDSYTGRFKAITGSLFIYIIGAVGLDLVAYFHNDMSSSKLTYLFIALSYTCLSIGEGAFKANASAFGGEQLLKHDAETYRRFFGWFYWAINIGSFIGYSLIAWVQVHYAFKTGYIIPICCLGAAFIIFLIPTSKYTIHPLSGNVLKKVFGIVREALSLRKAHTSSRCPGLEEVMPIHSWLDRAMCKYGGSYLDSEVLEVKTLGRIMFTFTLLIPYWMIYYQMNSTFLFQGLHMDLKINDNNTPAAWLGLADIVVVIIMIPLMDRIIYPWMKRKGWGMSFSKRISLGFLFAIASMFTAAIVECERKKYLNDTNFQEISGKNYSAADMSIFYQVPQYALIGISEVFASVGCLEFAYREAPESMHGFVMGLFYLIGSVGNLLGAGLYTFCSRVIHWTITDTDMTSGSLKHLDYYFYLLGGILSVTWLIFVMVSVRFRYRSDATSSRAKYTRLNSADPHGDRVSPSTFIT